MTRLIAAVAIDYPISQKPLGKDGGATEGRLAVNSGLLRQVKAGASSAVTAEDLARARQADASRYSTTRLQQLETLQSGLTALTTSLYRKEPARDSAVLDDAVRQVVAVGRVLQSEQRALQLWARR